jgi:hypothetical protein
MNHQHWNALLPVNERKPPAKTGKRSRNDHIGFLSFDPGDPDGWFMRRPPSSQHRLAVEMLRFIPKREELNKGERRECISVLYALTSVFDHEEVLQICQEA